MKNKIGIAHFLLFIALFFGNIENLFADGTTNQGFIENAGQWPTHVWARATFDFGDVIVQKDGILFFLRNKSDMHDHHAGLHNEKDTSNVIHAHVYKMKFREGTMHKPKGYDTSNFQVNYIQSNNSRSNNLSCYKKLIIENLYPYIDLVLYVTATGLKYDFILREHGDASHIQIDYEGLDDISVDETGSLQLKTSLGNITEKTPIAFLEHNTKDKEPVLCKYVLKEHTVQFNMKSVSRTKQEKLVIDPELIFATYSGSTADNWGNTATYDSLGSLYAAGIAFNFGFPVTTGAYQINFNSVNADPFNPDPDVAIMKFNATGQLVYATYLGGGLTEVPTSIIVNKDLELYILGTTGSDGTSGVAFPTTVGAYDQTFNGGTNIYPLGRYDGIRYARGSDLFVSRLSANGSSLISSTFIGGSANDGLLMDSESLSRNYGDEFRSEILLDTLGFVYIASHSLSNNIIDITKPGYDLTANGGRDGIIIKLEPDLSNIVWNTYWGGSSADACYSLQFGSNNNIFITGGTLSSNLPTTAGVVGSGYSGNVDGFILNLSNDGTTLLAATYIGTPSVDQGYLIQTDYNGFVYVLGQSQGSYPVINAPYVNPGSRQFIHKLSSALDATIFSTVIGSGQPKTDLVPTAFLVNDCENIFVAGWGGSVNYSFLLGGIVHGPFYQGGSTYGLPLTSTSFQTNSDGSDFYLMVLKKDLEKLLYSTYFGGIGEREHVDGGTSRFDKKGIVYQSVCAGCGGTSLFPVTPGAHSSTNNSFNCNNAVFKFDLSSLKADFIVDTTKVCGSGPVTFTNTSLGGAFFLWDLGDGATSSSATSFTHIYKQPGTYTVRLIAFDEATCIGKDTAEKIIEVFVLPDLNVANDTLSICKGDTVTINGTYNSNYTYQWSPNEYISNTTIYNPEVYPPDDKTYTVTVTNTINQCKGVDTIFIDIYNPKTGIEFQNITGCQGKPMAKFHNPTTDGFHFLWTFGDGNSVDDQANIIHSYESFGEYNVTLLVYNDLCSITDNIKIVMPRVNIPNLITPNNDNLNDNYVIEGITDDWKFDVYNRWGNLIYTRQPYNNTWNGEGLSDGVYYYLITDPQGNKCKGWVEILK